MKGITLILKEPLSEMAKAKFKIHFENTKERLNKMTKDIESGRFNDVISQL